MIHPDPQILNHLFTYDPEMGTLIRRTTGKPVYLENKDDTPHVVISAKRVQAKRVVVAMQTGEWHAGVDVILVNRNNWDLRYANIHILKEGEKRCSECQLVKPLCEFYGISRGGDIRARTGRHGYCIKCSARISQLKAQEGRHNTHRNTLRTKYNMTVEQYTQMLSNQGGGCKICGIAVEEVRYKKLVVDHCHRTGRIRGLLCPLCNAGLGMFTGNPRRMLLAAKYLMDV